MAIAFQKRLKVVKRLEKAREKAERRLQKKLAEREEKESCTYQPGAAIESADPARLNPQVSA